MNDLAVPVPTLEGTLRSHNIKVPVAAWSATGIRVLGRHIRTIIFTTDIAIIRNCDADAVFAVYPFTPQQIISSTLVKASSIPVFVGVGGGTTAGARSAVLAHDAEADGAYAVVLNAPASYTTLEMVSRAVDIPVVATIVGDDLEVVSDKIAAGAQIVNVAAGRRTPEVVGAIRAAFPDLPIIATGGNNDEGIRCTIEAGANAIVCSPPSTKELFSPMMEDYRQEATVRSGSLRNMRPVSKASRKEIEAAVARIRESDMLD